MQRSPICNYLSRSFAALALCGMLAAAPHRGIVKFGGLPVPGATVTATQDGKRLTAITGEQGEYSFNSLADGKWTLRVEMLCFAPTEREVAVAPNTPPAEWEIKVLPFDEIRASAPPVTATPAAPASGGPAKTEQAAAAPRKKGKARKGVPAPQVANTASGFQHTEANATADAAKVPAEEANGAAANDPTAAPSDGFLINGSVNNGAATPYAQSSAFGNNRKGMPSLYHGGLGLSFRDSAWDARAYSLTGQDTPKPGYSHVQGTASFGGPIRIPRLVPRNGPYLTVNYQWTRNRNASTQTARVPTAAERLGDFSQSLNALGKAVQVTDPATGAALPGNVVPQSLIGPQARALLSFYPLANFSGGTQYNYQVPLTGSTHSDAVQGRVNKAIGKKNTLMGSAAMQSTRGDDTSLFGFVDTSRSLGMTTSVNWMHRFGTRTFSTLGYQFSRQTARATPFFAGRRNVSAEAGITGNNQDAANWGPPALSFSTGIAGLSDIQNSLTRNQSQGITPSLFWAYGSHNLTVGADIRRLQHNVLSQSDARGTFTFTGAAAGGDFAGFLLGVPDTSSIAYGHADKYLRASTYSVYGNDDWRLSPVLTINGGVRWEYSTPATERYGRLVNLNLGPGFSSIAPVVAANAAGPLVEPYRRAVQPRIGLSWRPMLASSMVIRAGYGVYYDTSVYFPIASRMMQQSPLSKSMSIANSAANPLTLANGFSAPANATTNTFAVDPAFRPGYSQNWQLSMQRDLPGSLVMTATYLGTKGTRAQQQSLPQTYPTGAANPCTSCPSGYAYLMSNGNSTRQSGQLQLRRRLHSGITAQINYTYAKSIDDASLGGRGQGSAVIAQDWLNLSGERGLSNFDQRHAMSAQMQYTSGMGLAGGSLVDGWRGRLMKDWTIVSNINAASGLPETPIYLAVVRGTGVTGSIRPDFTGASIYDAPAGLHLNPAAVTAPATGRWGNAGRSSIAGPGQFTLNASMSRTFRFSDRVNLDFRLEATNALNHVTYPSWNVVATSTQFGLPSTANAMRNLQANFRVRF
jgi:trimeric autotransporter adhesin